jgi:microcystin-dependent protein
MDPLLGEIRLFPWPSAPEGWAPCDGALMSVKANQALFSLLGAKYGGDGKTTFALPDLRGRAIVGAGSQGTGPVPKGRTAYRIAQTAGEELVILTQKTMPAHGHTTNVAEKPGLAPFPLPRGSLFATVGKLGTNPTINIYAEDTGPLVELSGNTVSIAGSGQGHENMQPFAAVGYCIAIKGEYPPRQD